MQSLQYKDSKSFSIDSIKHIQNGIGDKFARCIRIISEKKTLVIRLETMQDYQFLMEGLMKIVTSRAIVRKRHFQKSN